MDDALRRSAAHLFVADVEAPVLDEAARHHLRVLRLRDGETVTVTDGAGRWRSCRLADARLVPDTDVCTESERPDPLTVAVAVPKGERADWLVQKCTEIGIDRIVIIHAQRSVVRWDGDRAVRHLERLRRIAEEAAMQSRRIWRPEVVGPVPASDVLGTAAVAEPGGRPPSSNDTTVAIGPEGGWTSDELAHAGDRVDLGPNVLRVETAAVVAATLMVSLR